MKKEYTAPEFAVMIFKNEDIMKTDPSSQINLNTNLLESESLLIYDF